MLAARSWRWHLSAITTLRDRRRPGRGALPEPVPQAASFHKAVHCRGNGGWANGSHPETTGLWHDDGLGAGDHGHALYGRDPEALPDRHDCSGSGDLAACDLLRFEGLSARSLDGLLGSG